MTVCDVEECVDMRSLTIADTHSRCNSDCDCGGGAIILYRYVYGSQSVAIEDQLKSLEYSPLVRMPRHTPLPALQNLHLPLPVLSSLPNLYPETLHDPLLILNRKGRQSWTSLCGVVLLSQKESQGCLFGPPGEWGFWSRLMRWGVTRLPIYVVGLVVFLICIESSLRPCGRVSSCFPTAAAVLTQSLDDMVPFSV